MIDILKKIKKYSSKLNDNKTRILVQGENLDVLDLLLTEFENKVRCIYIDPPYNNGENYTHYDDRIHDNWISDITIRLEMLKKFLTKDGSIWISIDDTEMHYLKIAADKVFGRGNFVSTIIWQQRTTRENRKTFSNNHEYILVYALNKKTFNENANPLPASHEMLSRYKNPDNDPKGPWQSVSLNVQAGHAVKSQFYQILSPSGKAHSPPKGRCWAYNKEKVERLIVEGRLWFGKDGNGVPRLKKYLAESKKTIVPETLWMGEDVGTNKEAKKQLLKIFPDIEVFDTPKPERLIERIFEISTNEGDLVLDAYVGSGVSVSVAHRLNRQYIGIDIGNQLIDLARKRVEITQNNQPPRDHSGTADNCRGYEVFKLVNSK